MRLFVALVPPPEALEELDAALTPLRAAWPALRWVRRELWHVTLAFYGDVDELQAGRLVPRLERAAGRHPRMRLALHGVGTFPRRRAQARVLWAGLAGDQHGLVRLCASVGAAGRRVGAGDQEPRDAPRPHLTLARCREPADIRRLVEELSPFAGAPWTAGEIRLVRSHLGNQVRYETLASWPLRGTSGEPSDDPPEGPSGGSAGGSAHERTGEHGQHQEAEYDRQ